MKKTTLFILLLSVAMTVFFLILNSDMQTDNKCNDKVNYMMNNIELIYKNNTIHVDTSIIDTYTDSIYFTLSNRVKKHTQFVLFVPSNYCNDCFMQEYKELTQMPNQIQNNLILLTAFEKKRDIKLWSKDKNLKYPIYNCTDESFLQELRGRGKISFFTLDTTYILKHLYIPIIFIPEQTEIYYDYIKNNIFHINKEELNIDNTQVETIKKKHNFGDISPNDTVSTEFIINLKSATDLK